MADQLNLLAEQENKIVENDIIDLDLSATKRKKFRFDHDDNRIVELNTSDLGIVSRISEVIPKLKELEIEASKMVDDTDSSNDEIENAAVVAKRLTEVDAKMRDLIDYLFDADVSSKAAPDGSMYDPFEGSLRFEHIISLLLKQYDNNIDSEYKKMENQLKKYSTKYIKK